MGETVVLTAYMDRYKRDKYTSIYNTLQRKHEVTMQLLFGDIEGAVTNYQNELRDKYATAYNYEYVDPGDIFEDIEQQSVEFYEAEKLMEYNFHFSLLATLYQMFEQQLRKFIYEELNHRLSPVRVEGEFADFGTNMGKIKSAFKHVSFDLEATIQWYPISVLADLVNTYKHGDGRSAKRLYKNHPEFFLQYPFSKKRVMDRELTTNTEIVFDLKEVNFKDYSDAIIDFWKDFPEHLSGKYTFPD